MAKNGGFVIIHRKLFEHPDLAPLDGLAFALMIAWAQWQDATIKYKGRDIPLRRGQAAMSVRDLARRMDKPAPWAQRLLVRLEKLGMIKRYTHRCTSDTGTDTPITVVTICNYGKYQDIKTTPDTPFDTGADTGADTQNNKDKQTKQNKPPYPPPSGVSAETWRDFMRVRSVKRAPMTKTAYSRLTNMLTRLEERGHKPENVVAQSVERGWTGVFETKDSDDGQLRLERLKI